MKQCQKIRQGLTAQFPRINLSGMSRACLYILSAIAAFLIGCSGTSLKIIPGNHLLLQSPDKQLSCYSGGISYNGNCCWPYKNKLMVCTYTSVTGKNSEGGSLIIRYIWDKSTKDEER